MNISIKWTLEKCKEEALKYQTRNIFSIKSRTCYTICSRNKWLDIVCIHMKEIIKPNGYWIYETCKKEALIYDNKKDFYEKCRTGYEYARKNCFLNEICSHMKYIGNRYKRMIYVYEFSDNSVYVGLTYNSDKRYKQHMTSINSPIFNYINKTGLIPKYKTLTEYVDVNNAQKLEEYYVNYYKENGFIILNSSKTGALGNSITKWCYENCKKEAMKYNTRNEFCLKSASAYGSASKNKWLDDICVHMICKRKPNGYWTFEKCKESSISCKNKEEYYKKFGGAFTVAKNNNWLNIFFPKKN